MIILMRVDSILHCANFQALLRMAILGKLLWQWYYLNTHRSEKKHVAALWETVRAVCYSEQPGWVSWVLHFSQADEIACHDARATFVTWLAQDKWWEECFEGGRTRSKGWSCGLWESSIIVAWLGRSQSLQHSSVDKLGFVWPWEHLFKTLLANNAALIKEA